MYANLRALIVLFALMAFAGVASLAVGAGDDSSAAAVPGKAVDPDYARAEKAIDAKDWPRAIELLTKVVGRDDKNADAYNYLGYAERQRGKLELAFKHCDRALSLNPKHLGVREYLGEAYLLVGNLPKAEEQLAALDKLCTFSCSEYRELKEKIADYKRKHMAASKPS
jgi:tetratricopeptide (TPR) repeat protein